jgi:hypothetical protein
MIGFVDCFVVVVLFFLVGVSVACDQKMHFLLE